MLEIVWPRPEQAKGANFQCGNVRRSWLGHLLARLSALLDFVHKQRRSSGGR